jgi:putative Holliday junction resolvase
LPRILAVDWGGRRIGLALSDPLGVLASPLPTLEIRGEAEAVARVADTIREVGADAVVVGLPLTLRGDRGEAAENAERFAARLREACQLEVSLYDERLTSALAQRRMRETGEKSRGRKGRVDAGAAVALLEGWLARLQNMRDHPPEDAEE